MQRRPPEPPCGTVALLARTPTEPASRYAGSTPPLNATVTLTVVAQTGNFKASYSHSGGSGQKTWANHLPPIEEYSAGGEQEHQCSRQDRAYVSLNQFRRQATGVWTNINNGSIDVITFPGTTPNWGHIDWCLQPTRFKFYINSQIPTGSCN